jgi:transcriptional regulator with XRE-family HTH domain
MDSVGNRLRKARNRVGLTQDEVANKLGVTRSVIARYESGTNDPPTENIIKMAEMYGVSADWLLCLTNDPRPVAEITETHRRIEEALFDDPNAEELLSFWRELKEREDLFLLFKQVRPLSDDSIRRVIRVIKAIEDEEAKEFGEGF